MTTYTSTMKWRNFNLAIRVKVNDGAVYLCALLASFLFIVLTMWVKAAADNFLGGLAAIWAISATMMKFQKDNNKLDVEAAKANAGGALNDIKLAAAGVPQPPPCKDESK